MKMKIKRISKSTLSVILAMMMLVSTSLVGMFTTTAATVTDDSSVGAGKVTLYIASDTDWLLWSYFNQNGDWYEFKKVDGAKFNNKQVYKCTDYYGDNNYLHLVYRDPNNSSNQNFKHNIIENSAFSNYDGKIYVDSDNKWYDYNGGDNTSYYVAGTADLVNGTEWSENASENKMTDDDGDGTYSITYTNKAATSNNGTYQFKITNGTWNGPIGYSSNVSATNASVGNNGGNIYITFTKDSDITINYTPLNGIVTVVATPKDEPQNYSLIFGSNNDTHGSVTAADASGNAVNSGDSVPSGTTVTFTATPSENYIIEGWYRDKNFTNKIASAGTLETYNVTVSTAVTVFVKFKSTLTPTYQVAIKSGSSVDMHETSVAGVYISDSIISNGTDFKIKNSDGKYAKRGDGDANGSTYYINSTNDRNAKVSDDWTDTYGTESCNDWKINCFDTYVVYDSNEKIVYLTLDPNNKQSFTIYAKSGTVRNDEDYNNVTGSLGYGITTVSGAGDIDDTTSYYYSTTHKYYNVAEDTAITITTTMSNDADAKGYYVWAFCVNGKYVEAIKDVDSDGNVIYRSSAYRLNSEDAVNNSFEITPIYLNRTIEADGDYIHLYVDASTVTDTWGNTIAVYPYAQSGETIELNKKPFGDYPGQPMVLNGRFYEILVPKHEYVEKNGKLTKTENYMFGLTVCSYSLDTIHSEITQNATNYQTYDYSDFIQLTKDADVTAALFSIKRYVDKDHYGIIYSNAGYTGIRNNIGTDWNNLQTNPFEDFTDFYGRNTDIFGNILDEDQIANTDKSVHIISLGNINISSGDDYTTIGQWATKWFVYDNEGNLISEGTPSQYIDENSPVRKDLLNNYGEKCENVPTYISYDKEKTDGGVRSDGRWYYSKVGDVEFTSDVAIEYNSGNGEWIEDENSGVKNEDGFVSTVTNGSVARLDGVREATYKSVDGTATISVDVKDGWTFAGWYIKSKNADDSYSYYEISKTNTTVNNFQMNNSYHIVARLEKIPEGSLVLRHAQYSGTNPPAHSGGSIVGQYFIKAVVKDSDNNIVKTYDFTEDPISIDYLRSDYTIDVTLKTVCYEPNTFYSWYQMAPDGNYFPIGPEDYDPKGQDGELTFAMNLKCSQLFNGQDLEVNVIRFYSDLVKVSGTCDITYKYYDRFAANGVGKMVSYVVNDVELSPKEIKEGYIPSDETIQRNAPYIDTIYLDTIWDLTDAGKVTKTKSYAEVTASQRDKKCTVYYPTGEYFNDGIVESEPVPFNAFLGENDANDPDKINFLLTAPDKNAEGKEFSYWNIYKAGENGQKTETLIATCYDRTFNFRIYDDYYLEVVYGEKIDEISAEISDPVMNREIFGDASSATDRLYVDLLVSYYSSLVPVFKDNNTNYTVECGVIVDRNNTNTLSDADMNSIKEAAQNGAELDPTILQGYFNDFGLDVDKALSVAQNQELGDKSKTTYTDTSGFEHRLSKYVLNNEDLTNKNRIDKVLVYTNNEANQKYIFAAYAYVIVRDADGTIVQCDISNANEVQFYNLCYTANIPAQTSAN